MEQLNGVTEIFLKQDQKTSSENDEATTANEKLFLKFGICGNYFLTPILSVKEIIDGQILVTKYPIKVPGHEGIINLRGSIIPIIAPYEFQESNIDTKKIIIFENKDSKLFGIEVSEVKKIPLPIEKVIELEKNPDSVILIDNITYRPFTVSKELLG